MQENLTEKVSVNMNIATLSQIDLLVDNGYYSNRSDFINQAVRQTLDSKQSVIDRILEQNDISDSAWFVGIYGVARETLERAVEQGKKLKIRGYGLLTFGSDCPDELIFSAVEALNIRGRVMCSDAVKQHFQIK